jgi:large subunit ribosomal protein L5
MSTAVTEKINTTFDTLKGLFDYSNIFQAPKVEKVIVSVGIGRVSGDKQRVELIRDRLSKITGQKPLPCAAKQSIAAFKTRTGQIIGFKVTLRGARMHDFLGKLIHVALPRTRDFRGLPVSAIDDMGNYTIGIREHTIFPETSDEDIKDVFGLAVTIVTTAKSKKESEAFLRHLGVPIAK